MKIATLCGSNASVSANHAILKAVGKYFEEHQCINLNLCSLPFFTPDNQYGEHVPHEVLRMREVVADCDLLVISTPEYAHGIPGILKNGLEWLFCAETGKTPVGIIVGSAQGEWARDQLIEVLTTMDFSVNLEQTLIIHGARVKIDQDGNFLDSDTQKTFFEFLEALKQLMKQRF